MSRGIIFDRDVVGVILINPCRVSSCTSNGLVPFRFWYLRSWWTVDDVQVRSTGGMSVSHTEVFIIYGNEKILRAHVCE